MCLLLFSICVLFGVLTEATCHPAPDGFNTICDRDCFSDNPFNTWDWHENKNIEQCAEMCTDGCTGYLWRTAQNGKCQLYDGEIETLIRGGDDDRQCVFKNPPCFTQTQGCCTDIEVTSTDQGFTSLGACPKTAYLEDITWSTDADEPTCVCTDYKRMNFIAVDDLANPTLADFSAQCFEGTTLISLVDANHVLQVRDNMIEAGLSKTFEEEAGILLAYDPEKTNEYFDLTSATRSVQSILSTVYNDEGYTGDFESDQTNEDQIYVGFGWGASDTDIGFEDYGASDTSLIVCEGEPTCTADKCCGSPNNWKHGWDVMSTEQQTAWEVLGESELDWNRDTILEGDCLKWADLVQEQQDAAAKLCYTQETWDAAHPTTLDEWTGTWDDLTGPQQEEWKELGAFEAISEQTWNDGTYLEAVSCNKWEGLGTFSREAATDFCYTQEPWDARQMGRDECACHFSWRFYWEDSWEDMTAEEHQAWNTLGETQTSWDDDTRGDLECALWADLTSPQRDAAGVLCQTQESWDEERAKTWDDIFWEDLSTWEQDAWTVLGATQQTWDAKTYKLPCKAWTELSTAESDAATSLCHDQQAWDDKVAENEDCDIATETTEDNIETTADNTADDVDCNVCSNKYLADGGCAEGASVDWDTGCDTCAPTAGDVYICTVDETSLCTTCHETAETKEDVTDNCWQSIAWACDGGTFDTTTCGTCDFTTSVISSECFTNVGNALDHVCDSPQTVAFTVSGLGVTADNFAGLKEDLEASVESSLSLSAGDVECSLPTTRRRMLADGDVNAVATVPENQATAVSDAAGSDQFVTDLNTAIAATDNDVLKVMTVSGVSDPVTTPVTTTTAAVTEAPTDPATDTTTTTAAGSDVDAGVSALSMIAAALVALIAM